MSVNKPGFLFFSYIFSDCNKRFYAIEDFAKHLLETESHALEIVCQFCLMAVPRKSAVQHMQCHGIGLYECVYCLFGSNSIDEIRSHMSMAHPNKLLYGCARIPRKDHESVSINYILKKKKQKIPQNIFIYIWNPKCIFR